MGLSLQIKIGLVKNGASACSIKRLTRTPWHTHIERPPFEKYDDAMRASWESLQTCVWFWPFALISFDRPRETSKKMAAASANFHSLWVQ
jgi:hypothetical protein